MEELDYSDIMRLQQEAEERAKEMNSRAVKDEKNDFQYNAPPLKRRNTSPKIDDDKLLILALMLILSKNCDDKMLLFALLYILM